MYTHILPFYSNYTGQPGLAARPVKNWRILLEQVLLPARPY